jgi:hypothetical protein
LSPDRNCVAKGNKPTGLNDRPRSQLLFVLRSLLFFTLALQ